jgi:hypothetical protein
MEPFMTRVLALCSVLIVAVILVPVAARAADPEFPLTIENHRFTPGVRMPSLRPGTHEFVGEYNEKTAKGRIVAE